MKKIALIIAAFIFVLTGCASMEVDKGTAPTQAETSTLIDSSNVPTTEPNKGISVKSLSTEILKEPPVLTVVHGDKTVEALRGTTSWLYQNENGTSTGIEADSRHPLQAKEYMTPLALIPKPISSIDPLKAYLQWNTIPDKILVRCWNEEYWGQSTAESEEIPVSILMIDSNIEIAPTISVELKDGNYIYEVVAEWNSAEKYSGTAYYSFYTVKPIMEVQSIPSFSYKEELETWKENAPGVYYDGFKNVSQIEIKNTEDIIERAKSECTVSYDTTKIEYDSTEDMWMVVFYTDGMVGGDQTIYLDGFGITHLIVYGE